MNTFIAFLRGINVGGKNRMPMSVLRLALENAGFKNVRTYIQSGNIVFESEMRSTDLISETIGKTIENTFGFSVPVLVMTKKQTALILSQSPYNREVHISMNETYFVLLFEPPAQELLKVFNGLSFANEEFKTTENCVHLLCLNGYGKARLNNTLVESKLQVTATARNYRTMQKVLALL
ncbi:DUF1697 domain-containing protein [Maribacter chungangensis]|uniref:DUF1697 domain-containing protein n=1 Tax=Maribacter chungangensis TaxID=1069117 RepID=A0ABW3B6E0_9FLAO